MLERPREHSNFGCKGGRQFLTSSFCFVWDSCNLNFRSNITTRKIALMFEVRFSSRDLKHQGVKSSPQEDPLIATTPIVSRIGPLELLDLQVITIFI